MQKKKARKGFLFLCLIIPPAAAGGIVNAAFLRGLLFALNQPAPVGADKINIPRCRGRYTRDYIKKNRRAAE